MDAFLGFLPFFNFNMKRRAIILKKSKGRRNPIVNFICLSFSSQFYWDIKKNCTYAMYTFWWVWKYTNACNTSQHHSQNATHTQHLQSSLTLPLWPCLFIGGLIFNLDIHFVLVSCAGHRTVPLRCCWLTETQTSLLVDISNCTPIGPQSV